MLRALAVDYRDNIASGIVVRLKGTDYLASPNQRGIRPHITGQMEFQNVMFRYENTVTPALDRVSFTVEEGQMIGIVGRSGSGKTTATRLIQGIHTAQEGLIRLNGTDIRHIDLPHLRRSISKIRIASSKVLSNSASTH